MTVDTDGEGGVPKLLLALSPDQIRLASAWLIDVASHRAVPADAIDRLDLCLNEALANTMAYSGVSASAAPAELTFRRMTKGAQLEAIVTVSDSGDAFDPTAATAKRRPVSLETAEPGGHGLIIMRNFADSLEYVYRDNRNVLSFGVRWTPAS